MIDYKCLVSYWVDDIHITKELILTIEEGYIEDQDLLEDVLLEKAKEYLGNEYIELIEFEELKQIEQANLYQITDEDIYYDEDDYTYKGDINNQAEEFIGDDIEGALDCIKRYRKHIDTYGY